MRIDWLRGGRLGDCGLSAIKGNKWTFTGRFCTVVDPAFVQWFDDERGWPCSRENANNIIAYLLMDAIYIAGRAELSKEELLDRWGEMIFERLEHKATAKPLDRAACSLLAGLFWRTLGEFDPEAEQRPSWLEETKPEELEQ